MSKRPIIKTLGSNVDENECRDDFAESATSASQKSNLRQQNGYAVI